MSTAQIFNIFVPFLEWPWIDSVISQRSFIFLILYEKNANKKKLPEVGA